MRIRIGYEIAVKFMSRAPMILMLSVRPELAGSLSRPDTPFVYPDVETSEYIDSFGNRCTRLVAPEGILRLSSDSVIEDSGQPDPVNPAALQIPIEELPDDTLHFLLGSRYCEVDRISQFAWDTFGNTNPGWERVDAVNQWVHRQVRFGYEFASATKTALDVLSEKRGVCRDFQHLAIALLRALGVPTRYATGYLSDIGMDKPVDPMDFSAWYQVYLDGKWWDFDARNARPRIGRILMAVGRDAADVALMTTFGSHTLEQFVVITKRAD